MESTRDPQRDLEGFWGAPQEPGAVWQVRLFHLPIWVKGEEGSMASTATSRP